MRRERRGGRATRGLFRTVDDHCPLLVAGLDSEMVQGTNLQHALHLAGRQLARHHDSEPVVLVVTDGEPTAHLLRDGTPWFHWPALPETLELTLAEVDRLTRRGATIC